MADERVEAILEELRALGSDVNRAGMARFAIKADDAFGVPLPAIRRLAKRYKREHELAADLWATGNHEARLLAAFIDDPTKVTRAQMEAWALDFDSWDICDQATCDLFYRTADAWEIAVEWAARPEEWVKRGGFALMAGLSWHDKKAPDEAFTALFPVIEREAFDERNFVRKAVNWALRNTGKRNRALNEAAVACAERIRDAANERAGGPRGGGKQVSAARWIAADALRELTSEKVRARLKS